MVETQEVTKAKFLEMYARAGVQDVIVVQDRIYGRTTEGQTGSYLVVYAEL